MSLGHRIPIRKRHWLLFLPKYLTCVVSYLGGTYVVASLFSPLLFYSLLISTLLCSLSLFDTVQSYTLFSRSFIPFQDKSNRLFLFAMCSSFVVSPNFTLDLMRWICFWQYVAFLVPVHLAALGLLIVQLLHLSQNEHMAHIIHVYYGWLRALVISRIRPFSRRCHLA